MRYRLIAAIAMSLAARAGGAQSLSGRWAYEENGQTAALDIRHDRATGRATGTFAMFGRSAPFEGVVTGGTLVIQRLGDVRASAENGAITATLASGTLMVTVTQPGQAPATVPMTRRGDAAGSAAPAGSGSAAASQPAGAGFRVGNASDFAGRWQFASPDGTHEEVVELTVRGTEVTGEASSLEHGYFSRRTTVNGRFLMRGSLANGALQLRVWTADGSPNDAAPAVGRLRGEYLVLRTGANETGYARPGRSLVQRADGSADAAALRRAVAGQIYSQSSQAGGRGGAIVGGRVRLALCSDGRIEYDASDVGSARDAGGSMGSTTTRRGTWTVVLYAGEPAIEAHWNGTGTSYSLTAYFRVRPDAAGRSANVDGTDLPVTGRC